MIISDRKEGSNRSYKEIANGEIYVISFDNIFQESSFRTRSNGRLYKVSLSLDELKKVIMNIPLAKFKEMGFDLAKES